MRRFLFLLLSIMFISTCGFAKESYYVSFSIGSADFGNTKETFTDELYSDGDTATKYEKNFVSDVKLGYDFDKVRLELEFLHHEHEIQEMWFQNKANTYVNNVNIESKTTVNTLFTNVYYDLDGIVIFDYITEPSIGIGMGYSEMDIVRKFDGTIANQSEKIDLFTWQSTISFNNQLSKNLSSVFAIQFMNYDDGEIFTNNGNQVIVEFEPSSIVSLGLRYNFNL